MSSQTAQIQAQLRRYKNLIYVVIILALGVFMAMYHVPKLQEYLLKINVAPLDQEIADLTEEKGELLTQENTLELAVQERAGAYLSRLDRRTPQVIDYYDIVRYFDNLPARFDSPGQLFQVDSITVSEAEPSLQIKKSRGKKKENTEEKIIADRVVVQVPMRVSELNLKRFIKEVYDTRNILNFLQDQTPLDNVQVAPFMIIDQLGVSPQVEQMEDGSIVEFFQVNATVSLYFQPYSAAEVEATIKEAETRASELAKIIDNYDQKPAFDSATAMIAEAKSILEKQTRLAQIKARSAELILSEISQVEEIKNELETLRSKKKSDSEDETASNN